MNVNVKEVVIETLNSVSSSNITRDVNLIRGTVGDTFKIYGVEFDSPTEIDDSIILTALSLSDIVSLKVPSPGALKEAIKAEFNRMGELRAIFERRQLKILFKGKTWIYTRDQDRRMIESTSQIYLNRVLQTPVGLYPGLCRIAVGDEIFHTSEPVKDFDGNEWSFATAGDKSVNIFSNGRKYVYQTQPSRIKFGSGGLYIVNKSGQIQNIFQQKYTENVYSKIRINRNNKLKYRSFDLVSCGRIMVLIETNNTDSLRISSIVPNMMGEHEVKLGYGRSQVLAFGGFSQKDNLIVYFVTEYNGEVLYDEYKFSIRST